MDLTIKIYWKTTPELKNRNQGQNTSVTEAINEDNKKIITHYFTTKICFRSILNNMKIEG